MDEEGEDWEVEAPDSSVKTYEGEGKEVGPGSELQIVNVIEFEVTPCHSLSCELLSTPLIPYHYFLVTSMLCLEDGEMLSAPIKGITESQPCNREASSSKCHPAKPHNASVSNYRLIVHVIVIIICCYSFYQCALFVKWISGHAS